MALQVISGRSVGIHAFIVGIDDYLHLPGDGAPPGVFGMKKLKTAASGAASFLEWLLAADSTHSLASPLATYEVLIAPGTGNTAVPPGFVDNVRSDHFVARAWAWRNRVAQSPDNIAVFYFGGHGIQRTKEDSVLLLQDFGAPGPLLANAVGFFDIFSGMAPSTALFPQMAATQFYFVDACRNLPDEAKSFALLKTKPVFDDNLGENDNRAAPVYFAAYNNGIAFGSQFTNALLEALRRGADTWSNDNGRTRWPVTTLSLVTGIANAFSKLTTAQDFMPSGHVKDRTLCYLDKAPPVDVLISVNPETYRQQVALNLQQVGGPFSWSLQAPPGRVPHPYCVEAPWGTHTLSVTFPNGGGSRSFGPLPINQKSRDWPVTLP